MGSRVAVAALAAAGFACAVAAAIPQAEVNRERVAGASVTAIANATAADGAQSLSGTERPMARGSLPAPPLAAADVAAEFFLQPYEQFNPINTNPDWPGSGAAYWFDAVRIADVTGDGRDDIVAKPPDNEVWIIAQRADGSLATDDPEIIRFGGYVYRNPHLEQLHLGDLNEDGVLDIATTGAYYGESVDPSVVNLLLSDGAGGFQLRQVTKDSGEAWDNLSLLDVDLDGHLDVVGHSTRYVYDGAGCNGTPVCTFRHTARGDGRGGLTFAPEERLALSPVRFLHVADVNDDGYLDQPVLELPQVPDEWPRMHVQLHDRQSGFAPPAAITPESRVLELNAFADFNHDGLTDLITGGFVFAQARFPAYRAPVGLPGAAWHPQAMLVADLDRDGQTDLLTPQFAPGVTAVYLQPYLQRNGVLTIQPRGPWIPANTTMHPDQFAAGDLDGDGCTDVVMAHAQDGLSIYRGANCHRVAAARHDFDGDRRADLHWRQDATGANQLWNKASNGQRRAIPGVRTVWQVAGSGDFGGDGKADLLWRNTVSGANVVWHGASASAGQNLHGVKNLAWQVAGVDDFDGDLRADILWRNRDTGANVIWRSGKATQQVAMRSVADLAWKIAGTGDFNGDGRADIFWRHAATGRNAIWAGGNAATPLAVVGVAKLAWQVVGVGDFGGDGLADVLWRDGATGRNVIWNSARADESTSITGVTDLNWKVAAVADYDADGRADILWRNSVSGRNVIWRRAQRSAQRIVAAASPVWTTMR